MSQLPLQASGTCTIAATGTRYVMQMFTGCRTCNLTGCYGVCAACAEKCHAGHDLVDARETTSYCDCGYRARPDMYPDHTCQCVEWKEATFGDYKAKAEEQLAEHQVLLAEALNARAAAAVEAGEADAVATAYEVALEVDWDSFEAAANPLKTWPFMTNYYYLYRIIVSAVAELCAENRDGSEKIGSLRAIRLVHHNEGLPPIERCLVADGVATFTASYCCYWHSIDRSDIIEGLVMGLGIWSGLQDALYAGAAKTSEGMGGVPTIVDMASFEFEDEEPMASRRKAAALINASMGRCWRSWGKVDDIGGWCSYPSDEAYQAAFGAGGIVIHNRPFVQWGPDENGFTPYYRKLYSVDYDIANRYFHIYDVFEASWQFNASYEVAYLVYQVVQLFQLGKFEEMTEKQHQTKMEILRRAAFSSKVEYEGDYSWLQQLVTYPCFYPKDNHERRATAIQMAHINSEKFRSKLPTDTAALEARRLQAKGRDAAEPEVCIASYLVNKVSFRGMKQERLIIITDRATYSTVPRFKGSAHTKKWHRISHAYYASSYVGKASWHTMGTPPLPKPPSIVKSATHAVKSAGEAMGDAGTAVASAAKDIVGLGGDAADTGVVSDGPFSGPVCALRYMSSRLAADEKPPKKWKLPEIPDFKDKILSALRSFIETLKSISLPSLPAPSLPKFKIPNLLNLLRKCKPSMPSLSSTDGAGVGASEAAAERDAGDSNEWSCATGQSSVAMDSIPAVSDGLADKDLPDIGFDLPDLNPIHMLEKIAEKIEACAEFVMEMPSKLGIVGVLHALAKSAAKASGLSSISLPKPDFSASSAIQKIKDAVSGLADAPGAVLAMLEKMGEEAKHWGSLVISAPKVGITWLLHKIIALFQSVELPHFDVKKHLPGVKLPSLPSVSVPTMKMPGFVGKIGAWAKGPQRPEHVEYVLIPIKHLAASKYALLEIANVIAGAATAFQESSVSSPYEAEVSITTTITSGAYNKTMRGFLREGKVSKPSGEGDALTPDEATHLEGPNSHAVKNAAAAEHARAQYAIQQAAVGGAGPSS